MGGSPFFLEPKYHFSMIEELTSAGIKSVSFEMVNIFDMKPSGIKMVFEEEAFITMIATLLNGNQYKVIPGKVKGGNNILWRIGQSWFKMTNQKAFNILKDIMIPKLNLVD